ncbi:uncharacterized protein [Mycetomoellerius zeteki]|uniref:uncharacterized protein n=1 Tax=Mycetomoellerius zeteki TaxID=64791 RepID=UPI00084E8AFD|nr:PREDICTED: uncharacterized protein LOC108726838 [Trachymyrmex zeteki]
MKTIRQTARETDEKYRKVRKSHITVEMSIKSMTSDLLSETKRLKEKLLQDTKDKKQLQQKISKIKLIEEKLRNEAENNNNFNNVGQTFRRELYKMMTIEEETLRNLNKEQEKIKEYIVQYENKMRQWNTIISYSYIKRHDSFSCQVNVQREERARVRDHTVSLREPVICERFESLYLKNG